MLNNYKHLQLSQIVCKFSFAQLLSSQQICLEIFSVLFTCTTNYCYAVCCSCNCMWTVAEFSAMSLNISAVLFYCQYSAFCAGAKFKGPRLIKNGTK